MTRQRSSRIQQAKPFTMRVTLRSMISNRAMCAAHIARFEIIDLNVTRIVNGLACWMRLLRCRVIGNHISDVILAIYLLPFTSLDRRYQLLIVLLHACWSSRSKAEGELLFVNGLVIQRGIAIIR